METHRGGLDCGLLAGGPDGDGRGAVGERGQGGAVDERAEAAATPSDGLIASPEPGWPQWRGPRRDGVAWEKGLLSRWPEGGPRLLWKLDGLGIGWSSPIVVGQRLYVTGDVGDDLFLYALDRNGAIQWRVKNGAAWKGSYPGARACSRLFRRTLVPPERTRARGLLGRRVRPRAVGGEDSRTLRRREHHLALSECLLVDGQRVIVTPGGKKALMAALDKQDGRTVWTTEPLGDDGTSHSSPILFRFAGRRLIAQCSSAHGFGVDADTGKLLWTVPLKNQYGTNVATPVYGSGSVFFVTPYAEKGRLYRLRASQVGVVAEHAWTSPVDSVTGSAVLVGDTLFAAGYSRPRWWFAIDWRTGQTRHELEELNTGAAVFADGRLYCLDQSGAAAPVRPGADRLEIVGRFRLLADLARDAWAHPVVNDGRLYLRYHDTLWCYDVKQR